MFGPIGEGKTRTRRRDEKPPRVGVFFAYWDVMPDLRDTSEWHETTTQKDHLVLGKAT